MKVLFLVLLIVVTFVAIVLLATPWIVYKIGLENIKSKPVCVTTTLTQSEANELWLKFHEKGPMKIDKLSPRGAFIRFFGKERVYSGENVAWHVARNHNYENLKNKSMMYWHLSGASLTIWLMRNWTAEQLLAKAKEIDLLRDSQHWTRKK